MNLNLNTIVSQTGHMKPDQTLYIRTDDTLGQSSGLGRLAGFFSDFRRAENRASVERLKQAVANHPEFKKLLSDSAIKHFFTQKSASGTALTVREVEALKDNLDTLNRLDQPLKVGRELVRSGALPEGFANDFAVFTTSHKLPLKTDAEQMKALRNFYEKKNFLAAPLRGHCEKAGLPQGCLDKAVKTIMSTDEFKEEFKKVFSGDIKSLNFNNIRQNAPSLAPEALALISALAGDFNTINNFNGLVEMVRAKEIAPNEAQAFLGFCAERGLSLDQPLERHRALGALLLEPRAEEWGADLAEKMKLPPEVGRTLANMPEVKGQILAKLLAPPSAPPTRDLVEKAAKEVMTGFLEEKGEIINKFVNLSQQPPSGLQERLSLPLSEARLQTLLGPILAGDALLEKLLAPPEKQTGLSLGLAEAALAFTRALETCRENSSAEASKVLSQDQEAAASLTDFIQGTLQKDALLLLTHHRGLDESALAGAIRQYLKPLHNNLAALEIELENGNIGGLRAQTLKQDLEAMREVLYQMGEQACDLARDNDLDEWGAGDPSKIHQSVRDLASLYGVKMNRVGYKETSALINSEVTAWFGPDEAPPSATALLTDEARRLAQEMGLEVNLGDLPLDALAAQAGSALRAAALEMAPAPLSPEQARGIVRQVVREEMEGMKRASDYIESLPLIGSGEGKTSSNVGYGITMEEKHLVRDIVMANSITTPVFIEATIVAAREMELVLDSLPPDMNRATMAKIMLNMASNSREVINAAPGVDQKGELERARILPAALMLALVPAMREESTEAGQAPMGKKAQALYAFLTSPEGKLLGGDFMALAGETLLHPETHNHAGNLLGSVQVMNLTRQILGRMLGQSVLDDPDFEAVMYYARATPLHKIPGGVYTKTIDDYARFLPGLTALGNLRPPLGQAQWNSLRPVMDMIARGFGKRLDLEQDTGLKFVAGYAREILTAMDEKGDTLTAAELWRVIFGKTEKEPADLSAANLGPRIYKMAASRLYSLAKEADPDADHVTLGVTCDIGLKVGLPLAKLEDLMRPGGRITLEDFRGGQFLSLSSLNGINEKNDFGLSTDFHRREARDGYFTWFLTQETETGEDETLEMKSPKGPCAAITLFGKDGQGIYVTNKGLTAENCQGSVQHREIIEKCREICGSEPQFHRVMQCFSQASTILARIITTGIYGGNLGEHFHFNMTAQQRENGEVVVTVENPTDTQPMHCRMEFTIGQDGAGPMTDLELVRTRHA